MQEYLMPSPIKDDSSEVKGDAEAEDDNCDLDLTGIDDDEMGKYMKLRELRNCIRPPCPNINLKL